MARILKRSALIGIGLVLFISMYPIRLAQFCFGKLFKNLDKTYIGFTTEVFAEVFYTTEDALKVLLPQAQNIKEETKTLSEAQKGTISKIAALQFDPELDKEFHFYIGQTNGQVTGYAVKDTVKGKWGPIHYMLALEPDGKIKDVVVLELKERRGRPVKERRFLDQFIGKTINDPIKLKKDIKGVAGATISSTGMSNGIRKLVYAFNELYKK